jgi:hypothetical protein
LPHRCQTEPKLKDRLAELCGGWRTYTRDDGTTARIMHETRAVDRVHAVNEAAFFDEFFHYLREIGLGPLLEGLDPGKRQHALYPFVQFVLFTIMRCVGGVQSQLATRDVLLTDEGLMSLLGFNAVQVQEGATRRGESRRRHPVEVRGPFSFETVADNIVSIGSAKLETMFNGAIRALAQQGVFAKELDVILDCTDDEATPSYSTDANGPVPSVTREKRPDVRANKHARKVEVTVWGWKLWVVWEPHAKMPLAMAMDGIQVSDNEHALAVLHKARANVAGYAHIRSVVLDRGFLDGKLLSALDEAGMVVTIPAKANLNIATDAREIARRAAEAHERGRTLEGTRYAQRVVEVIRGAGKNRRVEMRKTVAIGVRELPCDFWNRDGHTSKSSAKNFTPRLLNATVVLCWDGEEKVVGEEVVFLTTDPAEDPFAAFDAYDVRSEIENTCNREAKEQWFLEHHPKRSEAGVRVHAYFVFMCMALVCGFRLFQEAAEKSELGGKETGIGRYRRALEAANFDKIAVFIGERYGILRTWEFALLAGLVVQDRRATGETAAQVLQRLSCSHDTS